MKNFTRTRKILLWLLITIVLVGTPFVVISGHLIPFRLPASKSYNSTVEITQLNVLNGTSTQPTTSSLQNPLKLNRACYPVSRWAEMNQKANERYERVNTGVIFPSTVNAEKKLSPTIRSFITLFELYSVEDLCELSVLMDHHDFQGVKIYPITMTEFHVYFEGERLLLRKMPIIKKILMSKAIQQPNLNLAQSIMKAYPGIVLYVKMFLAKDKDESSIYSEWILTK